MDTNTTVGIVLGGLVVIIPLFITCITPIIKLNKTIQKLNDSIDRLNDEDSHKNKLLSELSNNLMKHSRYLTIDKKRIDNLSIRLKKIDGQEGFIDEEKRQ